jgi:hypothetical protein
MKGRRLRSLLVLGAVALAGCGVPGQSNPTRLDNSGVRVVPPASTTSIPLGTSTRHVDVCLIAGDHLVASTQEIPTPISTRDAIEALVATSRSDLPSGVRSAVNSPKLVTAGDAVRGVANVELNASFAQIAPADQLLALAQLVCTLTSLPGIGQVRFTEHGRPIDVPRGDSSLTGKPVSRTDYKRLLRGI